MTSPWRPAYVAIGSNLNDPAARVREAYERLAALPATLPVRCSRLYRTQPMGPQDQPYFVNAAAGLLSQLGARELLEGLLRIEVDMGRIRQERWGPRVIDLDLVWMVGEAVDEPSMAARQPGSTLREPELILPHPGVSTRNFVLYPLADIAPTLAIPGHGNVLELLHRAGDAGISVLEQ
jgi:2-amino-4-hydroxy-6-hydroxymethyldihydropteridine diphosphokinase